LSKLTKTLVILLSISSVVLCGSVVIFVAMTENYKEKAQEYKSQTEALDREMAASDQRFIEKAAQMEELRIKLYDRIQKLTEQVSDLTVAKRFAEGQRDELNAKINSWGNTIAGFEATISTKTDLLESTQKELDKARAELITAKKQLNDLDSSQYEKIVQIDTLKATKRNLLEKISQLEDNIKTPARPRAAKPVRTVTEIPSQARPARSVASSALKGLISEIGQSLVTISLGSADGVGRNMVFHITRGEDFICNVKITNVDVNKSAGIVELEMSSPRVGDTASTKL